jgi:putative ABC transport system permease protein
MATQTQTAPPLSRQISRGNAIIVAVQMAWHGLGANKLRSFLTMLGVIIGVGAVIIAIAIGEGSRVAVTESIQRLGTNVLTVRAGSQRRGQINFGAGTSSKLKPQDAEAILKECPTVGKVSPGAGKTAQVKYENKNTNTSISGTGEFYPEIQAHPVASGKYFTAGDIRSSRRVAVLGSTVAKDLFDRASPLNRTIRVAGQTFTVIGVLKEKGGMGFRNPDDAVYIPYTTSMRRLFGMESLDSIAVQARSFGVMSQAQDQVTQLLRKRHKITGETNDFMIFNQADLAATQNEQQDTFGNLIKYLAIVSLVVGGIGIMNIMLVSVTERTREIGIRKAIGARRGDVLNQFLLEALFLSLVGGLLGVAFGIFGANAISQANGWRVEVSPTTVMLAFSFSAIVGVFFGFYPAMKASRLSPIEALRYE